MPDILGEVAGKVWEFLDAKGAATATKIAKSIGEDARTVHLALGWLAREGKLEIDRTGRSDKFALRD